MGVAPSFANTHMGTFETDPVYYIYHLQPFLYVRYLGDIFLIIWQHGLEELQKFVHHLNSRTDSMTFTMEVSRE